jgi:hypothetical protein
MAGLEGLHHIEFFILFCAWFCIVTLHFLFHRESMTAKICQIKYRIKLLSANMYEVLFTYICMQVCHIAARTRPLLILDFTTILLVLFTCSLQIREE